MVSAFQPPPTQPNESFRLQFPFVFRRLQSLQLLLPGSPLSSTFVSDFSGPSIPRHLAASFPLSDLRCFRFLSSASVLDSDYSASASSFPSSSCLRLTVASSALVVRFRFLRFPRSLLPGFPCIPSRFRYSASLYVSFCPSLIRSHSRSSGAYFLLSLSVFSASGSLSFVRSPFTSGYSAFCSSFPFFPLPPHSCFHDASIPLSLPRFPHSFLPGFPCILSWFPYSAFLMVSFRPSLLRSRSCSTGDPLLDLSSGAGA